MREIPVQKNVKVEYILEDGKLMYGQLMLRYDLEKYPNKSYFNFDSVLGDKRRSRVNESNSSMYLGGADLPHDDVFLNGAGSQAEKIVLKAGPGNNTFDFGAEKGVPSAKKIKLYTGAGETTISINKKTQQSLENTEITIIPSGGKLTFKLEGYHNDDEPDIESSKINGGTALKIDGGGEYFFPKKYFSEGQVIQMLNDLYDKPEAEATISLTPESLSKNFIDSLFDKVKKKRKGASLQEEFMAGGSTQNIIYSDTHKPITSDDLQNITIINTDSEKYNKFLEQYREKNENEDGKNLQFLEPDGDDYILHGKPPPNDETKGDSDVVHLPSGNGTVKNGTVKVKFGTGEDTPSPSPNIVRLGPDTAESVVIDAGGREQKLKITPHDKWKGKVEIVNIGKSGSILLIDLDLDFGENPTAKATVTGNTIKIEGGKTYEFEDLTSTQVKRIADRAGLEVSSKQE
jgi:hypothetical protein